MPMSKLLGVHQWDCNRHATHNMLYHLAGVKCKWSWLHRLHANAFLLEVDTSATRISVHQLLSILFNATCKPFEIIICTREYRWKRSASNFQVWNDGHIFTWFNTVIERYELLTNWFFGLKDDQESRGIWRYAISTRRTIVEKIIPKGEWKNILPQFILWKAINQNQREVILKLRLYEGSFLVVIYHR